MGEDIFNLGFVFKCNDSRAVAQAMVGHLETPVERSRLKQKARDYIQKKQGGTEMACQMISEVLEQ